MGSLDLIATVLLRVDLLVGTHNQYAIARRPGGMTSMKITCSSKIAYESIFKVL